jgi:hypothetical protein
VQALTASITFALMVPAGMSAQVNEAVETQVAADSTRVAKLRSSHVCRRVGQRQKPADHLRVRCDIRERLGSPDTQVSVIDTDAAQLRYALERHEMIRLE